VSLVSVTQFVTHSRAAWRRAAPAPDPSLLPLAAQLRDSRTGSVKRGFECSRFRAASARAGRPTVTAVLDGFRPTRTIGQREQPTVSDATAVPATQLVSRLGADLRQLRPDPLSRRADGGAFGGLGRADRPKAGRVDPMPAALGPHPLFGRLCGPSSGRLEDVQKVCTETDVANEPIRVGRRVSAATLSPLDQQCRCCASGNPVLRDGA
jgi:hypothetical protein